MDTKISARTQMMVGKTFKDGHCEPDSLGGLVEFVQLYDYGVQSLMGFKKIPVIADSPQTEEYSTALNRMSEYIADLLSKTAANYNLPTHLVTCMISDILKKGVVDATGTDDDNAR